MTHILKLFLVLFLSSRAMATTMINGGEVSRDYSSVSLVINVTGVSVNDVKPSADVSELKNNLKIFFENDANPIRMTRGASDSTSINQYFYWDSVNMTPTKSNETSTSFDIEYRVTIYKNPDVTGGDTLEQAVTKKFVAAFYKYNSSKPTDPYADKKENSNAFLASRVFAAPNGVPEITSITGFNRGLKITWTPASEVTFTDSVSRTAPKVYITLVLKEGGQNVDFANESFIANLDGTASDSAGGSCTLDPNATNCMTCDSGSFLGVDAMVAKAAASGGTIKLSAASPSAGQALINDLKPDATYIAFLQYERGLKRSLCTTGEPILDTTFADKSGEKPAGYGTPTCFVASVAYGSRIHPYIDHLRWLRDAYLLKSRVGKTFVAWYYKNGESMAEFVGTHSVLKSAVRLLLLPIIGTAYVLKTLGLWPLWFLLGALAVGMGLAQRGRFKKSVL